MSKKEKEDTSESIEMTEEDMLKAKKKSKIWGDPVIEI